MPNAQKLGHLSTPELTEFSVPVLCTGIKYVRLFAENQEDAVKRASRTAMAENSFSAGALDEFTARALVPKLALRPEDRASWPYWSYGWHGTDGCDWRTYRTDKGIRSIPASAEESWPIPPYTD